MCRRADEALNTLRFALRRPDANGREIQKRVEWFIMPVEMKKIATCPIPPVDEIWQQSTEDTQRRAHEKFRKTFIPLASPRSVSYYEDLEEISAVFSEAIRRRESC